MKKYKILTSQLSFMAHRLLENQKDGKTPVVTLGKCKRKRATDEDSGKFSHYNPEFLITTIKRLISETDCASVINLTRNENVTKKMKTVGDPGF